MGDHGYVLFFEREGMFLSNTQFVTYHLSEAMVFGSVLDALDMSNKTIIVPSHERYRYLLLSSAAIITVSDAKQLPSHAIVSVAWSGRC